MVLIGLVSWGCRGGEEGSPSSVRVEGGMLLEGGQEAGAKEGKEDKGDGGTSTPSVSASAYLLWDPPTTNVDGTPLTDLAGFRVYRGTEPGVYTEIVDIPSPEVTTYTFQGLPAGIHYFAVTAYDQAGNESDFSNEVSKAIPQQ